MISQLDVIKAIFDTANENDKFIFIKGGWNIDLAYGEQTRPHNDIDFHYDIVDKKFWQNFFTQHSFHEQAKNDWYSVFTNSNALRIDFEGVELVADTITWSHGGKSNCADVYEKRQHTDFSYLGMRLNVEAYLKRKKTKGGISLRDKDRHDLDVIERITKR